MTLRYGLLFLFGLLMSVSTPSVCATASVAQVTDVRTGEEQGKIRFVVASDVTRKWQASIQDRMLILRTTHATTALAPLRALRARGMSDIKFEKEGDHFIIRVTLTQPLKMVSSALYPVKAGQSSRWVVDLVMPPVVVAAEPEVQPIPKTAPSVALAETPATPASPEEKAVTHPEVAPIAEHITPPVPVAKALPVVPPVKPIMDKVVEKVAEATPVAVKPAPVKPPVVAKIAPPLEVKKPMVSAPSVKQAAVVKVVTETVASSAQNKTIVKVAAVRRQIVNPIRPMEELADINVPEDVVSKHIQNNIEPFKGTKPLVVAIDAGHGGKDVGATSVSGVLEKRLTLKMAKTLKKMIDAQPGMRAVLTRDKDIFIPLSERPKIARAMGADVFISLHADSYHDPNIKGASFYVASPDGASSQLARFVASHSNNSANASEMGLDPWSETLATTIGRRAMDASEEDSRHLAEFVMTGMKKSGIGLQHGKVQSANFLVLKNIDMPSILIETGFISNPIQDKMMQDTQYQLRLAGAILDGLCSFAKEQPEPGIVYAKLTIRKGDSLAKIAQRHGITQTYLAKANNLDESAVLNAGQVIRVPVNVARRMAMVVDGSG